MISIQHKDFIHSYEPRNSSYQSTTPSTKTTHIKIYNVYSAPNIMVVYLNQ